MGRFRLSIIVFLVAMSMHAYQGNAEDVEPNPERRNDNAAQKLPAASLKQDDAAQGRRAAEKKNDDPEHLWEVPLKRAADPVAWFTGLLVLVGWAQWRALRRQADKMTASVEAMGESTRVAMNTLDYARDADRPWLGVSAIRHFDPAPGEQAVVQLVLLNSGESPALDVKEAYRLTVAEALPVALTDIPEPVALSTVTVVFPKQTTEAIIKSDPISKEENLAIKGGQHWLILSGCLTYRDRFGREHHTYLCAFHNRESGKYAACSVGNSVD